MHITPGGESVSLKGFYRMSSLCTLYVHNIFLSESRDCKIDSCQK